MLGPNSLIFLSDSNCSTYMQLGPLPIGFFLLLTYLHHPYTSLLTSQKSPSSFCISPAPALESVLFQEALVLISRERCLAPKIWAYLGSLPLSCHYSQDILVEMDICVYIYLYKCICLHIRTFILFLYLYVCIFIHTSTIN